MRVERIGSATLYLGDCRAVLPTLTGIDVVVTDPPYPDYYVEEYQFDATLLPAIPIGRGMVFWTSKQAFPRDYSAIHVWDKKTGCGSEYELIFEIGGGRAYKVFRHYLINSTVAASFTGDVFTGHKSQKPLELMLNVVGHISARRDLVLDPFMGSGTTGVACAKLGRRFIGIEIDPGYYEIALRRIEAAQRQPDLFVAPPKATQEALF